MRINLAGGSGPMGKVHRPMFEAAEFEVIVSGRNPDPTNGVWSFEEGAENSDITIVTVPIRATEEIIKRVGPYCTGALMDFTGIKGFPMRTMNSVARADTEFGGLHPMYGEVPSIKGENVIYCPSVRSRELCEKVIGAFRNAGANITQMNSRQHDQLMHAVQNERIRAMQMQVAKLRETRLNIGDLYQISPPPTRMLIDLVARQIHPKNDNLYEDMLQFNPNSIAHKPGSYIRFAQATREFFGNEFLKRAQARATELMKQHKQLCYP